MINNRGGFVQFKGWQSLLITAGVFILIFFVAKAIFSLLYYIAIPLLIATAIINYKVILGYLKNLGNLFKRSPLMGIGAGVLSAFLYPVVIAFLFVQALLYRKSDKIQAEMNQQKEGEYVAYEEVTDEHIIEPEDLLEELNKKTKNQEDELDYWDLLDDDDDKSSKRKNLW